MNRQETAIGNGSRACMLECPLLADCCTDSRLMAPTRRALLAALKRHRQTVFEPAWRKRFLQCNPRLVLPTSLTSETAYQERPSINIHKGDDNEHKKADIPAAVNDVRFWG
jgi:hypothetical protein